MTRRPARTYSSAALYDHLSKVAEAEARALVVRPGVADRLAAIAAGQPVDVSVGDLPAWAREGQPMHWWRRATVAVTGAVDWYDDDGSRWLADNGL